MYNISMSSSDWPLYCVGVSTYFLSVSKAENCIVSYHVTCGFKVGLEMKSRLDTGIPCVFNEVKRSSLYM